MTLVFQILMWLAIGGAGMFLFAAVFCLPFASYTDAREKVVYIGSSFALAVASLGAGLGFAELAGNPEPQQKVRGWLGMAEASSQRESLFGSTTPEVSEVDPAGHLTEQHTELSQACTSLLGLEGYLGDRQTSLMKFFESVDSSKAEILADSAMSGRLAELAKCEELSPVVARRLVRMRAELALLDDHMASIRKHKIPQEMSMAVDSEILGWVEEMKDLDSARGTAIPLSLEEMSGNRDLSAYFDRALGKTKGRAKDD